MRWGWIARAALALVAGELAALLALSWLHLPDPVPTARLSPALQQGAQAVLDGEARYLDIDPILGWTVRPHGAAELYHSDALGLRVTPGSAGQGRRALACGDSFVHGDEVPDQDVWSAALVQLRPDWSVYNAAVPGYGPDQALLRCQIYRAALQPDLVLYGINRAAPGRAVSVFRPFLDTRDHLPFSKPRYQLDPDGLRLLPSPLATRADLAHLLAAPAEVLPALGAHDAWYQRGPRAGPEDAYAPIRLVKAAIARQRPDPSGLRDGRLDPASEGTRLLDALVHQLHAEVSADGAAFLALYLPDQEDAQALTRGGAPAYTPLMDALTREGIAGVDAAPILVGGDAFEITHYSAAGHARLARLLAEKLP